MQKKSVTKTSEKFYIIFPIFQQQQQNKNNNLIAHWVHVKKYTPLPDKAILAGWDHPNNASIFHGVLL